MEKCLINSPEELPAQIAKACEKAKEILAEGPQEWLLQDKNIDGSL